MTSSCRFRADLRSGWRAAERIMLEEAGAVSASQEAQQAMETMTRRYPVPRTEVEPKVFVRATDNWMELAARFVVPARTTRTIKSELAKRIRDRFDEAGIVISSTTNEQFVRFPRASPPLRPRCRPSPRRGTGASRRLTTGGRGQHFRRKKGGDSRREGVAS